jgi:hypothetical protein
MIKEIFIISPTDVYPYIEGQKQLPSLQSQANAKAAINDFYKSGNQDSEKAIIVLGGNGHSNKEYLEQKISGLGAILGKTEAELISEFIENGGIPQNSIYIEKNPSFNTIENAVQAYEVNESQPRSKLRGIWVSSQL